MPDGGMSSGMCEGLDTSEVNGNNETGKYNRNFS
jgi:hypothetical protein